MRLVIVTALSLIFIGSAPVRAGTLRRAAHWNEARAAHLLRRAGFGGTAEQVRRLHQQGLDDAVSELVDYDAIVDEGSEFAPMMLPDPSVLRRVMDGAVEEDRRTLRQLLRAVNQAELQRLRAWWVRRMVTTKRPFEEKMTLFWHGHFTTGAREVRATRWLADQNAMLRNHAMGPFDELLSAICRDPAMLRYLDNAGNRKQHPNENFARELLELFTLGTGNYSEEDIREAARALTGWSVGWDGFRFRPAWHDDGIKTFLGVTGRLGGDDVASIIMEQPALSEHLAERLLRFFVVDDPPRDWVEALAVELRSNDYDIRETMRSLFLSEMFYDTDVVLTHIQSPPELVVSTIRTLGTQRADYALLAMAMRGMGQNLFQPPNVKGWDGGRAWISSATLFKRYGFAVAVLAGGPRGARRLGKERREKHLKACEELRWNLPPAAGIDCSPLVARVGPQAPYDPLRLLDPRRNWRIGAVVDEMIARLLPGGLEPSQRRTLVRILGREHDVFRMKRKPRARRQLRALLRAIMTLPEYQLS